MALRPATGEVRLANAGHCPPLVTGPRDRGGHFVCAALSRPVGSDPETSRPETSFVLPPGDTLLLFTDGMGGPERVRRVAGEGPHELDALCDHLLETCTGAGRDDDVCLLGLRMAAQPTMASSTSSAEWPQNPAGASR